MKRILLAFVLSPIFAAFFCGLTGALDVLSNMDEVRHQNLGVAHALVAAFVIRFYFGFGFGAAFEWTLGVLVFVALRSIKKESMLTYSMAGLSLGFFYGLVCHREGLWLLGYSLFGLILTAGFWAVRGRTLIQTTFTPPSGQGARHP
jgi:hypothetical protein